jgi:hypothetical protein
MPLVEQAAYPLGREYYTILVNGLVCVLANFGFIDISDSVTETITVKVDSDLRNKTASEFLRTVKGKDLSDPKAAIYTLINVLAEAIPK